MIGQPAIRLLPLFAGLCCLGAWLVVNHRLFRDPLSPLNLLFIAWVGPLFLQAANLSGLESAWSLKEASIVAWVTFVLVGTSVISGVVLPNAAKQNVRSDGFASSVEALRTPWVVAVLLLGIGVAIAAFIFSEFVTNPHGIPLLTILREGPLSTHNAHRWGKETRWAVLSAALYALTPLAYFAAKANQDRQAIRRILLSASASLLVLGVLKLSRSDVFVWAISIATAAFYWRRFTLTKRLPTRKLSPGLVIAALAVMAGLYAMMSIRVGGGVGSLYAQLIEFRVPDHGILQYVRGPFSAIYGYLALPFDNLNRFLMTHPWNELHPGISITRPVLSVFGMGDVADRLNQAVYYPPPATFAAGSATFLTSVYAEGGILAAALAPIVYAALVNGVYCIMRLKPSIWSVLLYSNFIYPWVWLFFNNGLGVLTIYLNAALILLAMMVVTSAKSRTSLDLRFNA